MAEIALIQNEKPIYSENILPTFATFNEPYTFTVVSGEENVTIDQSTVNKYAGLRSVKMTQISPSGTCIFNALDELETTITQTGNYILSARFFVPTADNDAITTFFMGVYIGGILLPDNDYSVVLDATSGFEFGKWCCFAQVIPLEITDVINFQFKVGSNKVGSELYFDGFKLELNDRNIGTTSIYSEPIVTA